MLHSQEKAARGTSQSKKRRRDDSPPSAPVRPQKRPAAPPLRTSNMSIPVQDHTHLSPLSAHSAHRTSQSMSRTPQSAHQQQSASAFPLGSSNLSWDTNQLQGASLHGQVQRTNQSSSGNTSERRQTTRQVPEWPLQSNQQFLPGLQYSWNNAPVGAQNANHWASQSSIGQQHQGQQRRQQNQPQPRPHTAPDGDFTQVQTAFLQESQPVPPGQDELENMYQYIAMAGFGTANSIPQSTAGSNNEPLTPSQQQLPSTAVEEDSEDDNEVDKLVKAFQAEVHAYRQQYGKYQTRNLDLSQIMEKMSQSSRGAASEVGLNNKSTAASASSRSGKSIHMCLVCNKPHFRASDLKKHMKRHSRPYGCVLDDCYKRFGSKDDLKRHGETHPEQKECYRCDGKHRGPDGQPCLKVYYNGRDNYKRHLQQLLSADPNHIEQKANECRIPANNVGRFWCGFCNGIIDHEHVDHVASASFRLSHIDSHFSSGRSVASWIELGGNGSTKADVEKRQNLAKAQQIHLRNQERVHTVDDSDNRGTSSSSSLPENQETVPPTHQMSPGRAQLSFGQGMQRQTSNVSAYSQMSQQRYAQQQQQQHLPRQQPRQQQRPQQQMSQQMQRANSHNAAMQQQAAAVRDPASKEVQ